MKVKIGDTVYSDEDQPIMLVLDDKDKENIKNMLPECSKICSFPEGSDSNEIEMFMEIGG